MRQFSFNHPTHLPPALGACTPSDPTAVTPRRLNWSLRCGITGSTPPRPSQSCINAKLNPAPVTGAGDMIVFKLPEPAANMTSSPNT